MLPIDLSGKRAFVAGIADDHGYGWAIAKAFAQAGASVCVGTWPPFYSLFERSLQSGRLDTALAGGGHLLIERVYPLDVLYDHAVDVPEEVSRHRSYAGLSGYTIHETAQAVKRDFGEQSLDILVHSIANGPEVKRPLLATTRKGYLTAVSASAYSLVGLVQHFGPLMRRGGAVLSLSYLASQRVIPGYGGGMNSAKAALESDTRVLAFEAGRKYGLRVNCISPGPLPSRAARAIGTIEKMIEYYQRNAALPEVNTAAAVGHIAAFLASPLAAAITGVTLIADKGYHVMGMTTELTGEGG